MHKLMHKILNIILTDIAAVLTSQKDAEYIKSG